MSDEISVKDSLLNLNTTLLSKPSLTLNPITSPEKSKIISTFCPSPSKINTPNECGWTPLYRTVIAGDLKATELLIQVGADPNIQSSLGETPLYQSVEMNQIEHVKLLLKYNSDPNISQNDGMTPLHLAVIKQEVLIVKLLLKYKAKANAKTKLFEQTPVHFAIKGNVDPTILLLLIQYNGSLVMKDKNGKRPIDYVNSEEMRNALKKLKLQKEEIFKSPSNKNLYSTPSKNNWTINQVYTNTITSDHAKRNIELSSKAVLQDPGNVKLGIIEVRSGNKDDNRIGKRDDNRFINEESGFKKKLTFNDLDNSVIKENEQEYEIDSHKENNVSNYNHNTNKSNLENNSVNYNHNTNKSNKSNYNHSTNKSNQNDVQNDNKKDKNEKKNINDNNNENNNKKEENKNEKDKKDENELIKINNKVNVNQNENNKKREEEQNKNDKNNKLNDKNENIKENDNKKENNNNNKEKQINEKITIKSDKKNKGNNMNININVKFIDTTNDNVKKKSRKKSKKFIISKKINETSDDEQNIKNIDINGTIIQELNKNNIIQEKDTQTNMSDDSINTVNELESNKENNNLYSNQLSNDEMNTNTIIKNKYNNYKNQILTTNRSKLSKYENAYTQTGRNQNNSFVSKKSYLSYQDIPFQSKISKENSKFSTRPSDELNHNNYNKSDNIKNNYYVINKRNHCHHHNKFNSYNTTNTIPSRLSNEKEEVEYIIYSNINGAEPKNLLKYICSNYQNIDISEVDTNPIYQFLKSIDLICYYKLLVSKGIFSFEKVISDMKKGKFKITINDIEEIGINNPGHIYRIITKLEIDSEIIPVKISSVLLKIREILSENEDFLNSSVHFNYGFNCCSSQKTKLISSVNFNLEFWLKRNKLVHLHENFIRNGFDKLDYITLQMFSSFPINDNILRNDLHIYNEKERDILIFQLNRDVKSILKRINKNNVYVTTNSTNSDSNNYDICNIF